MENSHFVESESMGKLQPERDNQKPTFKKWCNFSKGQVLQLIFKK